MIQLDFDGSTGSSQEVKLYGLRLQGHRVNPAANPRSARPHLKVPSLLRVMLVALGTAAHSPAVARELRSHSWLTAVLLLAAGAPPGSAAKVADAGKAVRMGEGRVGVNDRRDELLAASPHGLGGEFESLPYRLRMPTPKRFATRPQHLQSISTDGGRSTTMAAAMQRAAICLLPDVIPVKGLVDIDARAVVQTLGGAMLALSPEALLWNVTSEFTSVSSLMTGGGSLTRWTQAEVAEWRGDVETRHALLTQMRSSRLAPCTAKAVLATLKRLAEGMQRQGGSNNDTSGDLTRDGLVAALVLGGFLDGALTQPAAERWYKTGDGKRTAVALAKACLGLGCSRHGEGEGDDELSELRAMVLRARLLKALHVAVLAAPPGTLAAVVSKLVSFLAEESAVPTDVPAGLTVEGLAAASAVLCPRVAADMRGGDALEGCSSDSHENHPASRGRCREVSSEGERSATGAAAWVTTACLTFAAAAQRLTFEAGRASMNPHVHGEGTDSSGGGGSCGGGDGKDCDGGNDKVVSLKEGGLVTVAASTYKGKERAVGDGAGVSVSVSDIVSAVNEAAKDGMIVPLPVAQRLMVRQGLQQGTQSALVRAVSSTPPDLGYSASRYILGLGQNNPTGARSSPAAHAMPLASEALINSILLERLPAEILLPDGSDVNAMSRWSSRRNGGGAAASDEHDSIDNVLTSPLLSDLGVDPNTNTAATTTATVKTLYPKPLALNPRP